MTKRKFFSGNSVRQAVVAAASHFNLPVDEIAYQEVEKKHGFLKMRKRVIIEVDEENPQRAPSAAPHPQREPDEPARLGASAPRGSSHRAGAQELAELPGKPPVGVAPPDEEEDEGDEEIYDAGDDDGEDDDLDDDDFGDDDFGDDDDDDYEDDEEDDDDEDDDEDDDYDEDEDEEDDEKAEDDGESQPAAPPRGSGRRPSERGRGGASRSSARGSRGARQGRGAEVEVEEAQPGSAQPATRGLYDEDDDNIGNRMVPGEKPPHEKRGVWSGQPLEPARGAGRGAGAGSGRSAGRGSGRGAGRGRGGDRGSSRGRKPAESRGAEAERSPARGRGGEAEPTPPRDRSADAERIPARGGEAEREGGRRSGGGRRRDRGRGGRGGRGGDLVEIPARGERDSGRRVEAQGEEADACRKALDQILLVAGIQVEAKIYGSGERYDVELSGNDEALLTAEGGELLRSVQHLLPRAIRGVLGRSLNVRVDCSDFREIHEERLRSLAQEVAGEVRRSGRAKKLDPMPPADRRIIHLTLADEPDVSSNSEGRGHYKQVVVRPD